MKKKGKAEEWGKAKIIHIQKKGDSAECANCSLLTHDSKVFAMTIHNRIKTKDEIYGEEQACFRSGRGTSDHIFTFTTLIEK